MVQRFVLVLDGSARRLADGEDTNGEDTGRTAGTLDTNDFLFCPDRSRACGLSAQSAGLLVFELIVARSAAEAQAERQGRVDASPLLDTGETSLLRAT